MSTHIQTWEYIEAVKENGKLKEQIGTLAASASELEEKIERLRSLLFRAASNCDDETLAGGKLVADIRAEIGWEFRSHE